MMTVGWEGISSLEVKHVGKLVELWRESAHRTTPCAHLGRLVFIDHDLGPSVGIVTDMGGGKLDVAT